MKTKGTFFRTILCALLFAMTFTTLTAFADTGDIINPKFLGYYYYTQNSDSFISISNTGTYPVTAIRVYDSYKGITFSGSGDTVGIDSTRFSADFYRVRRIDANGNMDYNNWYYGVTIGGNVSVSLFSSRVKITMDYDERQYVKN